MKRDVTRLLPDRHDILRTFGVVPDPFTHTLLPALGILAAGAVLGAGFALLFAPDSGEGTRRQLSERARTLRDRISEAAA